MVKQYKVTVNGVSYDVTVESAGGGRGGYAPAYHPAPAAAPAKAKPWADYPQTADGAFAFFCAALKERRKEDYSSEKHDEMWFGIYDGAAQGTDPDEFTPADVQRLMEAVDNGVMPF